MEAAAGGDPYVPIYISSDEEEDVGGPYVPIYISPDEEEDGHAHAYFTASYDPEDIEIQEVILLSLDASRTPAAAASSSSLPAAGVSDPREPLPDRKGKRQVSREDGSSDHNNKKKKRSKRGRFDCAICFETVEVSEKFAVSHCAHAFCNSCVGRYVAGKIAENVAVVGCPDPGCEKGVIEMDLCRDIVPPELFDRWNVTLCENLLGDVKLYCPFKDCSALLINDGSVKIRETECPHCHRLFCVHCRVPWHNGIKRKQFSKLGDDEKGDGDLILKKLAKKQKWQRCPKCKMYVSRTSGCSLIKCRCEQYFCYTCAGPMDQRTHYCKKCRR